MALVFLSLLHVFVLGQLEGSATLWTSFVPLAVRSPYLSAWMDTSNVPLNTANPSDPGTARAPSIWPVFYQNNAVSPGFPRSHIFGLMDVSLDIRLGGTH